VIEKCVARQIGKTERTGDMRYTFSPGRGAGRMPQKEGSVMDERMRVDPAQRRREYGRSCAGLSDSRKTGYKINFSVDRRAEEP
jgi:hypothetical protein